MRPRRTAEGTQLKFMNDDPNSSGATLALLDVESGRSTGMNNSLWIILTGKQAVSVYTYFGFNNSIRCRRCTVFCRLYGVNKIQCVSHM